MKIFKKEEIDELEIKITNQIRTLALDIINNYGEGNDGITLSAAPTFYTLFSRHLNIMPNDPKFINRDRFIIASPIFAPLLYASLYMAGYDYTEEDLKKFGLDNSKTKTIPDLSLDNGIEISVSSNSDVFASSLGYGIASTYLSNYFKSKNIDLINYYSYIIIEEKDLMDGLFNEAISMAGNLKLNKLVSVCHITNNLEKYFNENIVDKLKSMNWNVVEVSNSEDIIAIDKAIDNAKSSDKPTMILIKTVLGKYSNYEGNLEINNHILNDEDISAIKSKLDLRDISFTVSSELMEEFQNQINSRINDKYNDFINKINDIEDKHFNKLINSITKISLGELESVIEDDKISNYAHIVLNTINNDLFMSLSCDDFINCGTYLDNKGDFSVQNRLGNNLNIGNRKQLLSSISTGLTLSGIRNICSLDINNSDLLISSIKYASKMNLNNIYIFTGDNLENFSIDVYRNIENVEFFRPNDLNEVIGTFKTVLSKSEGISIVLLSNKLSNIENSTSINDVNLGGYVVKMEEGIPFINLISSGIDLNTVLELEKRLVTKGIFARVISMPSINRFNIQSDEYKNKVIDLNEKTFVIDSLNSYNYLKYTSIDNLIKLDNIDNLENIIEKSV